MLTKPLVAGLLAAGCVSAAAGGAYVAVRQNAVDRVNVSVVPTPVSAPVAPAVGETEAVVASEPESPAPLVAPSSGATPPAADQLQPELERPAEVAPPRTRTPRAERPERRAQRKPVERSSPAAATSRTGDAPMNRRATQAPVTTDSRDVQPSRTAGNGSSAGTTDSVVPAYLPPLDSARTEVPAAAEPIPALPEREFIQVVVPASSVIGLQVESSVSTEKAHLEDRVDARVTRDVLADGHVAIPAGSRVIGSVMLVEQGGKIKERARLGIRFHTIVFADGSELPIRTEAIYRDGESPGSESAKKIGGAAVGGAILGAIIGGGKGAMIGGAAGAGAGTAATMAGGRNPATLPAGAVVTVRLSEPLTLDREKQEREL